MQLKDLITPMDQLSDEELMERLRELRHRRNVIRPAAAKRVERAEKKEDNRDVSKVEKLLKGLSADEIKKLLGG